MSCRRESTYYGFSHIVYSTKYDHYWLSIKLSEETMQKCLNWHNKFGMELSIAWSSICVLDGHIIIQCRRHCHQTISSLFDNAKLIGCQYKICKMYAINNQLSLLPVSPCAHYLILKQCKRAGFLAFRLYRNVYNISVTVFSPSCMVPLGGYDLWQISRYFWISLSGKQQWFNKFQNRVSRKAYLFNHGYVKSTNVTMSTLKLYISYW